jgi:hypothetical protein
MKGEMQQPRLLARRKLHDTEFQAFRQIHCMAGLRVRLASVRWLGSRTGTGSI